MNDRCPVRDAESLQPLKVPVHRAKQMWVTMHVPDDAAAGVYQAYHTDSTSRSRYRDVVAVILVIPNRDPLVHVAVRPEDEAAHARPR